jgi:hypothetical protein
MDPAGPAGMQDSGSGGQRLQPQANRLPHRTNQYTGSDDCRAYRGLRSADTGRRPGLPGNTAPGRATDRRPLPPESRRTTMRSLLRPTRTSASGIVDACGPKSPDSHRVVWGLTSRPPVHPVGFPPVSRLPAGFFLFLRRLWFAFDRRSPVRPLRPWPGSGSPPVSLRGPLPLSNLHASAAAVRFGRH